MAAAVRGHRRLGLSESVCGTIETGNQRLRDNLRDPTLVHSFSCVLSIVCRCWYIKLQ